MSNTKPLFTDCEYRILLSALSREKKVCQKVDKEFSGPVSLVAIIDSVERKIKDLQNERE